MVNINQQNHLGGTDLTPWDRVCLACLGASVLFGFSQVDGVLWDIAVLLVCVAAALAGWHGSVWKVPGVEGLVGGDDDVSSGSE